MWMYESSKISNIKRRCLTWYIMKHSSADEQNIDDYWISNIGNLNHGARAAATRNTVNCNAKPSPGLACSALLCSLPVPQLN